MLKQSLLLLSSVAVLSAPISLFAKGHANKKVHAQDVIFTMLPVSGPSLMRIGLEPYASFVYRVENTSGVVQKNMQFTFPGKLAGGVANACQNGMTLAPNASCSLGFDVMPRNTGPITIGQRSSTYALKACGYGGVGDDCSAPNQASGLLTTYVLPSVIFGDEGGGIWDPPFVARTDNSKVVWSAHKIPLANNFDIGLTASALYDPLHHQFVSVGTQDSSRTAQPGNLRFNTARPRISVSKDGKAWTTLPSSSALLPSGYQYGHLFDLDCASDGHLVGIGGAWNTDAQGDVAQIMPYTVTSSDGLHWAAEPLPMPAGAIEAKLYDVHTDGQGHWMAVGKAWMSGAANQVSVPVLDMSKDNGKTWQNVPMPRSRGLNDDDGESLKGVTYSKSLNLWLAAGNDTHSSASNGSSAFLLSSADGQAWARHPVTPAPGYDDAVLRSVTCADSGGCTAVGWQTNTEGGEQAVLIERSTDGVNWVPSAVTMSSGFYRPQVFKVHALNHTLIATGRKRVAATLSYAPLMLRSLDGGVSWAEMPPVPLATGFSEGSLAAVG